jgi:hypothetical protein
MQFVLDLVAFTSICFIVIFHQPIIVLEPGNPSIAKKKKSLYYSLEYSDLTQRIKSEYLDGKTGQGSMLLPI